MPTLSLSLAALIALLSSSAGAQQPLDKLAWLAGCWAADGGEPGSMEQWMAPAGGTMLGMSRTLRAGRVTAHEFMAIRTDATGAVEYHAMPSGQKPASFPLVRLGDTEAVFENPAHDFPQRVIYAQAGPGKLAARIEGRRRGGELKVVTFPMTRVPCEPATPVAAR